MGRYVVIAFIAVGVMAWAGWQVRHSNQILATVLLTLAVMILVLMVGGLAGVIGG